MRKTCLLVLTISWLWVLPCQGAEEGGEHRLEPGQTLARLARLYGVSLERLLEANPALDPHRLPIGTRVKIPGLVPVAEVPEPSLDTSKEVSEVAPEPLWEMVTLADGRRAWAPRAQLLMSSRVPLPAAEVVSLARRFLGTPYRWGGQTPNGVDCSGYVQEVFRLGGHDLPRLADEQFAGTQPVEEPEPGDLVFFTTYQPGPSHVGISLGGREFLHASSSQGVTLASLDQEYFQSRYLGARRLTTWDLARRPSNGLKEGAQGGL